ncbi:hypothetical protein SeMB42_g03748 [Synchytrium endobioticum]|uniref:Endo-beta-1,6-galactanase-like domain-containing protein n=1 Tax=Synchytrium endobioticum TaxID=286115 RepID=A0A507D4P9_9FUNG|nr:hypothetical protein SeLEV6574_g05734 [Synchytrium endobioticum]TPX46301.1 hypothetical protein SeMB42_g03748 [Synchytrium endobioticum]
MHSRYLGREPACDGQASGCLDVVGFPQGRHLQASQQLYIPRPRRVGADTSEYGAVIPTVFAVQTSARKNLAISGKATRSASDTDQVPGQCQRLKYHCTVAIWVYVLTNFIRPTITWTLQHPLDREQQEEMTASPHEMTMRGDGPSLTKLSPVERAVVRLTPKTLPLLDGDSWHLATAPLISKKTNQPKNPRDVCIRRSIVACFVALFVLSGIIVLVLYFTNAKVRSALTGPYTPAFNASIILLPSNFVNGSEWLGFGTSLAWWGRFAGEALYGKPAFTNLMDAMFDVNKGLGLTVVRYNIGGTGPNAKGYPQYYDMPAVQLAEGGPYDFDLDYGQRNTLLASMERGVIAVELFSQSPPWWMTTSGSTKGNWDGSDNLVPSKFSLFADYLAKTIIYYQTAHKLAFYSVAPFSEPTANWWDPQQGRQEGCHWDLPTANSFVAVLHSTLTSYGLNTLISSTDDVAYSATQLSLQKMNARDLGMFGKVNTHGYFDPPNSERASFGQVVAKTGKKAWMSELGTGGQSMNPAAYGIREFGAIGLARQIVADIYYIGVTSWVYWQAVDIGGDWGLVSIPSGSYDPAYFDQPSIPGKQYYVMMQYSKWLRPGMDIIASDQGQDIAVVAARSVSDKRVVIVALNSYPYNRVFGIDLSVYAHGANSAFVTSPMSITAYRTSDIENHANITAPAYGSNAVASIQAPPNSVTTMILDGLTWK